MSVIHKYKYDMDNAPILDYRAGSLIELLNKCLITGWTTSSGTTISGAGWESPYKDLANHKATYRSTVSGSRGHYLWVDDSATYGYHYEVGNYRWADVQAFENMVGFNYSDGSKPFSGDNYRHWFKTDNTNLGVNPYWILYATNKSFYLISGSQTLTSRNIYFFGDYVCRDPNFLYNTAFTYGNEPSSNRNGSLYYSEMLDYSTTNKRLARAWSQTDTEVAFSYLTLNKSRIGWSTTFSYPNPLTGELLLDKLRVYDSIDVVYMGDLPGLYEPLHQRPFVVDSSFTVSGTTSLSGVNFDAVVIYNGQVCVQTSGYWY